MLENTIIHRRNILYPLVPQEGSCDAAKEMIYPDAL